MALKVGELYASFGIDSSDLSKAVSNIESKCNEVAASMAKAGAAMSLAITTPLVSLGKNVFDTGKEFEAQMSRVQAIAGATGEELELLTQNAIDLGAASVFSASESAQGMEYLASAGFDVNEIIAAMPGMLNLAASSGEDLATSADIAAATLRGFGLEAEQAGHVADVLAVNAARTNAAVADTGEAMKYIAPIAHTMGLSLEEVTASIGIMADYGIKGGQAGTTLRSALSRLAKPTKAMQTKMDELGLSFYDSNGKMKSLTEMISMMQTNMAGLTDEQKQNAIVTLFGQEALSGMMVLMDAGPEKIAELTKAYEECDGAAAEMAETMLDNLKGAIEGLDGSLETAKLNLYYGLAPAMTDAVKKADSLVDSFNQLDDATKNGVYKTVALAAAAGPLLVKGGAIVAMVGKLIPMMTALASPMSIVAGGLALFAAAAIDANNDIGNTFVKASKKINTSLKKINSEIQGKMQTVSNRIPALSASLVEGIQNIVPEFMDTALLAVTGLMDTISDNASNIAEIGKTIITSILDGISKNLPSLVKSGVQMATSIVTALAGNMPSIVKAAGNIATALMEGITSVDWVDVVSQLTSAFTSTIDGLTGVLNTLFSDFKTAASTLDWATIGTQIIDLILGAAVDATTSVGTFLTNLVTSIGGYTGWSALGTQLGTVAEHLITGIANAIPGIADTVANIVTAIGTALSGEGAKSFEAGFKSLAGSIISGLADAIPKVASGAVTIITAIGDLLTGESAQNLVTSFGSIATTIIQGIVDEIPHVADAAVSIIGAIGSVLSGEKTDGLIQSFDSVATSIINSIIDSIPKVTDAAVNIIGAIGALLSGETTSNLMSGLQTIAQSIIDGIVAAIPAVTGAAVNIIGAIANLLSGESAENLLNGMTGIATTIIEGIASAIPSLTAMAGSIVTAIGNLLATIDWANAVDCATTLGKALLDAIVAGIKGVGEIGVKIVEAIGTMLNGIDWGKLTVSLEGFATMLINGIVKGIETYADAEVSIISALGDVLGGIDWNEFGEYAKSLGSVLIDGIVTGIKAALDGATKIVSALGEMLQKIDWKELGNTAADLALSLVDGIVEGLKTVDFADFLAAIGSGIKAAGEGLGEAAGAIVNKLVTAMLDGDNWIKLIELGGKLVEGIAVGIYNLGKGILEGAWGFVKGTLKGLFEGLGFEFNEWSEETEAVLNSTATIINTEGEEINTSLQNMLANISTLDWAGGMNSESLANAMQVWKLVVENGTDEMIAAYQEFAFLGCEEITSAFQILCDETASASDRAAAMIALNDLGLGDFVNASFASCDTEIIEAARRMSENGVTTFEEAFALLGITIPEAVQAGIDSGMPLVEAAAAAAAEVAGTANDKAKAEAAASETGSAVTEKLSTSVEDGTPTVETSATSLSDAAQLAIDTLPDAAAITGEEATTAMSDAIDNGADAVTTSMDTLASDVVEAALKEMSYTTGYKTGNEYVKAMKNGITAMQGALVSATSTAAKAAVSAASSTLTSGAGSSIGYNFAQGIAQGIRNGSSAIKSAARSAAQSALSAAKSSLGIHSPSTVAEKEIGWMWDAGLAKGVLGKVQFIEKAAGDVTDSLHDSFMVGDPSRGTVYTSGDTIRQTAKQTAEANSEKQSLYEKAETIGRAIADRLIESGALDGDVIMDGDKVGEKVSNPVSRTISRKSRQTVKGRSVQGVIA